MRKKSCTFAAESCRSGRTGQTRNLLNPSGFRGFESLTFRSPSIKGSEVVLHSLLIRRTFGDSSLSQEWTDNQNKVLRCRTLIDGLQGRSRQRKGYPIPHSPQKSLCQSESAIYEGRLLILAFKSGQKWDKGYSLVFF